MSDKRLHYTNKFLPTFFLTMTWQEQDVTRATNIDLVYTYTKNLIKYQEDSLSRLDTKLSGFLAFIGLLIKFAMDLPEDNAVNGFIFTILKGVTIVLLIWAAFLLIEGIRVPLKGEVVRPEALMQDKWLYRNKEIIQAFIVKAWIDTVKAYENVGIEKANKLDQSIILIFYALIISVFDTLLPLINISSFVNVVSSWFKLFQFVFFLHSLSVC